MIENLKKKEKEERKEMEPKNLSCSQKKKHFKLIATVNKKIPYGMNNFPNTSFLIWNKICDKNVNAGDFK